jgi:hypothetical protein
MRRATACAAILLLLIVSGCGWNRANVTTIEVLYSGRNMLHVAVLPRVLPDGSSSREQSEQLLKELTDGRASYTFMEKAVGDWRRLEDDSLKDMPSDLLIVQGPPALNTFLTSRLATDFKVKEPMVVSIHGVSPARLPIYNKRDRGQGRPNPEPEQKPAEE